jgi:hypothetical protein
VFHTVLGLFEVKTAIYDRAKDLFPHADDIHADENSGR